MMSEIMRNLTPKEEYYKLITDEKSNHIETNANGAGSQCVRRKNIGSLSFRKHKGSRFKNDFLFLCCYASWWLLDYDLLAADNVDAGRKLVKRGSLHSHAVDVVDAL